MHSTSPYSISSSYLSQSCWYRTSSNNLYYPIKQRTAMTENNFTTTICMLMPTFYIKSILILDASLALTISRGEALFKCITLHRLICARMKGQLQCGLALIRTTYPPEFHEVTHIRFKWLKVSANLKLNLTVSNFHQKRVIPPLPRDYIRSRSIHGNTYSKYVATVTAF